LKNKTWRLTFLVHEDGEKYADSTCVESTASRVTTLK
jgi:hypothetical protein